MSIESSSTAEPGPVMDATVTRKLSKVLPSDRLTMERHLLSMRAFGIGYSTNGSKPVTNEEAGKIVGMAGGTIVVSNAFLVDIGILSRKKDEEGLVPSPDLLAYCSTLEWNAEMAKEKLRGVFERAWFSTALVPRVKIRPFDLKDAVAVLAEAANASKEHEERLERLLEFMIHFGVVIREGNLIRSASTATAASAATAGKAVEQLESNPARKDDGLTEFILPLDPKRKERVFVVRAPATVTQKELERIKSWLGFQLIVDEEI